MCILFQLVDKETGVIYCKEMNMTIYCKEMNMTLPPPGKKVDNGAF